MNIYVLLGQNTYDDPIYKDDGPGVVHTSVYSTLQEAKDAAQNHHENSRPLNWNDERGGAAAKGIHEFWKITPHGVLGIGFHFDPTDPRHMAAAREAYDASQA